MNIIKFPGFRYGPKGESQIFEREEDVPKGWTDNPNDFKKNGAPAKKEDEVFKPEPPKAGAAERLTLEEIKENLKDKPMGELWKMATELGVDKSGKKPELIDRLAQKLQENQ